MGTVKQVPFATGVTLWSFRGSPGSLLEWTPTEPGDGNPVVEWRNNDPWSETLTLETIERGRSAARFIWRADDGRRFPMFMIDMLATARCGIAPGGRVTAWWMVNKRGQNYGIALANAEAAAPRPTPHADPTKHGCTLMRTAHGKVIHLAHRPEWASWDTTFCHRSLGQNPRPAGYSENMCIECVQGFNVWYDNREEERES